MLSLLKLHLLVAILAVVPVFAAYPNPEVCAGACWAHDPALIRRDSDGLYFKFNTAGNVEIATSTSLNGPWTLQGFVFTAGSSLDNPGNKDLWAPDVSLVNGVYHMYYSASTFGSQVSAIGLATSPSMDPGTWTDRGAVGIASKPGKPYNAIDANLIPVGSEYYMNFGSFWGNIYQVKLNDAATKTARDSAYQLQYDSRNGSPSEGAYMFYYSGYYYLTWSLGICCGYDAKKPAKGMEYKIMMCRSSHHDGDFIDKDGKDCTANGGSPLLESHNTIYGPGGQGVFNDPSKGLILYYHYAETTKGLGDGQYLFGWNALKWSGGWPYV
ncbi:uncharacterized protein L3040_007025 [Drepanopeziza brunnea f. sp. 'multigermtubi']|uniref:Arabinan endo-1,5-alpha-L-arabinosidase n=1 Tax=Marssonina brunnea f. sp. multigermtubi (strain MB_m1) TaxID=1072389 RepID=K1WVY7_MARBU|nr:glycoside hydrolase, family 43 [Drepanopeziza brunnea f. sp. 'multigermtubi' MB_m1]EKD12868.1 glycoside hydrolase, family 43 [Drepanopeziza brunnea f. sp. 'multigermtubi' MB_m1]KAJ5038156.1 hypothetical protein L3040_007025 [Drepanopeziza brunnea f. sp. 'multigermtubi']